MAGKSTSSKPKEERARRKKRQKQNCRARLFSVLCGACVVLFVHSSPALLFISVVVFVLFGSLALFWPKRAEGVVEGIPGAQQT